MRNAVLLIIIFAIHIIGAIITIIIQYINGTFELASLHGDGVRYATPFDIICIDCVAWEVLALIRTIDFIEETINNSF